MALFKNSKTKCIRILLSIFSLSTTKLKQNLQFKYQMSNKVENFSSKDSNYDPSERKKSKKSRNKHGKKFNICFWNQQQNKQYFNFLKVHQKYFENQNKRRKSRVFMKMSQYIQSRDADQCRSHHQKIMRKYGPIDKIIQQMSITLQQTSGNLEIDLALSISIIPDQNKSIQDLKLQNMELRNDQIQCEPSKNSNDQKSFTCMQFSQQQLFLCLNFGENMAE